MAHAHFLTFGDGSPQTRGAANRLRNEVSEIRIFAKTDVYHLKRIRDEYPSFWKQHGRFLLTADKMGFYLWTPFLVAAKLAEMKENDFLVYADAGCEVTAAHTSNLLDMFPTEPATDISVVPLEPFHTTLRWTNSRCLAHLDSSRMHLDRPMIATTFMFLRNTAATRQFAAKWLEWSIFENYCCLVDRPGDSESPEFKAHRHDQAIFSLLAYDFERRGAIGVKRIDIEKTRAPDSPIHGIRNRTRFRSTGASKCKQKVLSKFFSAAVKAFWNEEKYRADLYESLEK